MRFSDALREALVCAALKVCSQKRTAYGLVEHAIAIAKLPCSRTISNALCVRGREQRDWSGVYKLFSRSEWDPEPMFDLPLGYAIEHSQGVITVAVDDTKHKKTGVKIPGTSYQRDPMSPPFHPNFIRASRFLQAAVIVNSRQEPGARSLPVAYREVPVLKKPGKRASEEQIGQWKHDKKTHNLPRSALQLCGGLRQRIDALGAADRNLLATLDGGFCNRAMFCNVIDRVDLVARCRTDARLCFRSDHPGRFYDAIKFTPNDVRQNDKVTWQKVEAHYGGQLRQIRCKEVNNVLWQGGAKRRLLRLIVIAPQPYRTSPNSKVNYRNEAYYLTTDLRTPLHAIVQAALDRWQIEVNNREEKTGFGVGEAQVRSAKSVPRHPAFAVLVYSLMHMCALTQFGANRPDVCMPLPKWRRGAKRPSIYDLRHLLLNESQNMRENRLTTAQEKAIPAILFIRD